jgi:DNA-binding NarL/FixJ family response regulator
MAHTVTLLPPAAERRGPRATPPVVGPARAGAMIRVVIADGQALVRAGLQSVLDRAEDIAVVGHAPHGDEAATLTCDLRPDVLLVDDALPGLDALELTRRIVEAADLSTRILFLSASETDYDRLLRAVRAGISGFLLKNADPDHVAEAVRAVAGGGAILAPTVARRLMAELASQPDVTRYQPEELDELTAREREVVALVAGGLSNYEIAEHLVVSPATAKTHVSRALCKLGARDRAQLVRLAYETGLVVARTPANAASAPRTLAAA